MSLTDRSILLLDIAARAEEDGVFGVNLVGWYKTVTISDRQYEVIEQNDYVEWTHGAIFISGRGRDKTGIPEVQIWWAEPVCPMCKNRKILSKQSDEEWKIECCSEPVIGGVRDICVGWLGYCQRRGHITRGPIPGMTTKKGAQAVAAKLLHLDDGQTKTLAEITKKLEAPDAPDSVIESILEMPADERTLIFLGLVYREFIFKRLIKPIPLQLLKAIDRLQHESHDMSEGQLQKLLAWGTFQTSFWREEDLENYDKYLRCLSKALDGRKPKGSLKASLEKHATSCDSNKTYSSLAESTYSSILRVIEGKENLKPPF